jgi:hypothetical protein
MLKIKSKAIPIVVFLLLAGLVFVCLHENLIFKSWLHPPASGKKPEEFSITEKKPRIFVVEPQVLSFGEKESLRKRLFAYFPFEGDDEHILSNNNKSTSGVAVDISLAALASTGAQGQALEFSPRQSPSGCVRLGKFPGCDLGEPFTICFWLKQDGGGAADILSKKSERKQDRDNYFSGYRISVIGSSMTFRLGLQTCEFVISTPRHAIPKGKWRHVAFGFDGALAVIMINARVVAEKQMDCLHFPSVNNLPLTLASYVDSRYYRFSGTIDELCFYHGCLTAGEVEHIMLDQRGQAGNQSD